MKINIQSNELYIENTTVFDFFCISVDIDL